MEFTYDTRIYQLDLFSSAVVEGHSVDLLCLPDLVMVVCEYGRYVVPRQGARELVKGLSVMMG